MVEVQERTGGAIRTRRQRSFQIEHGPNRLLDTDPILHEVIYASDQGKNHQFFEQDGQTSIGLIDIQFPKELEYIIVKTSLGEWG